MIRVERATPAHFERVEPLLALFENAVLGREQWRVLFDPPWPTPDDSRGFCLVDDDEFVGFFGTMFSVREIEGRAEKMCNLTSWVTRPSHRNHSLLLLREVLALRGCTISCHTPAPHLVPLYRRAGFAELETRLKIGLPIPSRHLPAALVRYRVTADPEVVRARGNASEYEIFEHHRKLRCQPLLVYGRRRSCLVIATRTKGRRHWFGHIHYVSDPEVFAETFDLVKIHLGVALGTWAYMMDARLAKTLGVRWQREAPLANPHFFRSETLRPEQVDNLYTELVALGL